VWYSDVMGIGPPRSSLKATSPASRRAPPFCHLQAAIHDWTSDIGSVKCRERPPRNWPANRHPKPFQLPRRLLFPWRFGSPTSKGKKVVRMRNSWLAGPIALLSGLKPLKCKAFFGKSSSNIIQRWPWLISRMGWQWKLTS